jgi:hypothetical protein
VALCVQVMSDVVQQQLRARMIDSLRTFLDVKCVRDKALGPQDVVVLGQVRFSAAGCSQTCVILLLCCHTDCAVQPPRKSQCAPTL